MGSYVPTTTPAATTEDNENQQTTEYKECQYQRHNKSNEIITQSCIKEWYNYYNRGRIYRSCNMEEAID